MSQIQVRPDLAGAPAYRQGRSPAAGDGTAFKISSNENPYPPLPSVVDAAARSLTSMNRYPDSSASLLRARLAAMLETDLESVVVGSGSVEIVSQLIRATSGPGSEVLFAWRSFEAYPMLVRAAGATPVQVPLTADHRHDLAAMSTAVTERTSLIIVCNPNNPTGTTVGAAELEAFLDTVPTHVPVLIDEAYVHFNRRPDTAVGMDLFRTRPNIVVAHTFSKAYGLAGLRVGYAVAPTALASAMRAVALPFGVTAQAQVAAIASLDAEAELQERVEALVAERTRVVGALTAAGWTLPETQTNFLWLPLGEGTAGTAAALEREGLLVRAFAGEGFRATIAETEANDRLIAALGIPRSPSGHR